MMAATRRTSDLLRDLARGEPDERVTIGDIFHALEEKAFAALILILALPNCLPMIPGVSTLTGLGILVLALQLAWGRDAPWLPGRVRASGFRRGEFARVMDIAGPWIERLERLASPRLSLLVTGLGQRVVGLVIVLLSCVLMLPIPFVGNIPPGLAIVVLALGLLERDGRVVAFGYAVGTLAVLIVGGLFAGIVMGVDALAF